jgi:hypothetical protein
MCRLTRHYSVLLATFVSCNTESIFSLNLVHRSFIFASLQLEIVQRTLDPLLPFLRDVGVSLGGLDAAMPHQFLNILHVHAIFKQVRGKQMAQGMLFTFSRPPTRSLAEYAIIHSALWFGLAVGDHRGSPYVRAVPPCPPVNITRSLASALRSPGGSRLCRPVPGPVGWRRSSGWGRSCGLPWSR